MDATLFLSELKATLHFWRIAEMNDTTKGWEDVGLGFRPHPQFFI